MINNLYCGKAKPILKKLSDLLINKAKRDKEILFNNSPLFANATKNNFQIMGLKEQVKDIFNGLVLPKLQKKTFIKYGKPFHVIIQRDIRKQCKNSDLMIFDLPQLPKKQNYLNKQGINQLLQKSMLSQAPIQVKNNLFYQMLGDYRLVFQDFLTNVSFYVMQRGKIQKNISLAGLPIEIDLFLTLLYTQTQILDKILQKINFFSLSQNLRIMFQLHTKGCIKCSSNCIISKNRTDPLTYFLGQELFNKRRAKYKANRALYLSTLHHHQQIIYVVKQSQFQSICKQLQDIQKAQKIDSEQLLKQLQKQIVKDSQLSKGIKIQMIFGMQKQQSNDSNYNNLYDKIQNQYFNIDKLLGRQLLNQIKQVNGCGALDLFFSSPQNKINKGNLHTFYNQKLKPLFIQNQQYHKPKAKIK